MNFKHFEINIDKADPFANCKLEREKYANILTSIVESYSTGFVLAINNEWGTGKTTFVKMWQQQLENREFRTLYFNAWENDFESSPMVAIMSELKTLVNDSNIAIFKSLIKKGGILSKAVLPSLIKALAEKYIDSKVLVDAIENSTKAATEILNEEIKEYTNRKESLKDFRIELATFISKSVNEKPIIFIIDELDRCRPNYAVEVLEQIKHFFSVKGIVFALSIDKIQLEHAVKGVYGSEKMNSQEYLRRFIDIEYSIPKPNARQFCKYLFEYFEFDDFFQSDARARHDVFRRDKESFISMAATLMGTNSITLRQQEKIFAHSRLILRSFSENNYIVPNLFFFLVYVKVLHFEIYQKIFERFWSLGDLDREFHSLVPLELDENDVDEFLIIQGQLMNMYKNYHSKEIELVTFNTNTGEEQPKFISKLDKSVNNGNYLRILKNVVSHRDLSRTSIEYLLRKINLTDPIN